MAHGEAEEGVTLAVRGGCHDAILTQPVRLRQQRVFRTGDEEKHVCECAGPCSDTDRRLFDWYGPRYFVENVFEGLDSPAWKLGFEPIDLSKVGPRTK